MQAERRQWTTRPNDDGTVDVLHGDARFATFGNQTLADGAIGLFEGHESVTSGYRGLLDYQAMTHEARRLLDTQQTSAAAFRQTAALWSFETVVLGYRQAYTALQAMPRHRIGPGLYAARVQNEDAARERMFTLQQHVHRRLLASDLPYTGLRTLDHAVLVYRLACRGVRGDPERARDGLFMVLDCLSRTRCPACMGIGEHEEGCVER